jgi:elongation factor G
MDRIGADFHNVVEMMRDRLGANPIPLQIPIGSEEFFEGMIDLVTMKELVWSGKEGDLGQDYVIQDIRADLADEAEIAREELMECLSELDDAFAEAYLEGDELSTELIKSAIRHGVVDGAIHPVLCGTAFKNKGVQPLLDSIIDYLPSPLDVPAVVGIEPRREKEEERKPEMSEPFSALVFKIMTDPFGTLAFIRVYSGSIKVGQQVVISSKDAKKVRVGRILMMHANTREDIDELTVGNIAAIVGLKDVTTGDTLCPANKQIVLEKMDFPEPVIGLSIEPKTKADQDKMANAIGKLLAEDPSLQFRQNEETGQTIISGMGELHLEVIVERLKREFGVKANVGKPQVAYRETITKVHKQEGKFIKQSGGRGNYGHVVIELSPYVKGTGDDVEGFCFKKCYCGWFSSKRIHSSN